MASIKLENKRYLIAVSGGPDSMALLDMARKSSCHIEVAHVNYHKRDSAKNDELLVRRYCRQYGIAFHKLDVYPEEVKGNFQAYARDARYSYFNKLCKKYKLDAVLVGHHKDDLIETYLMQKKKNIGVDHYGLAKENTVKNVKIIRPLLKYDKKDLIEYCEKNNIEYGIDESNLSDDYARNLIRHSKVEKMSKKEKDEIIKEINDINKQKQKEYNAISKYLDKEEFTVEQFLDIPYLHTYLRCFFKNKTERFLNEMIRQIKESKHCVFKSEYRYIVKEYGFIHIFDIPKEYSYTFESIKDMKSRKYEYFKLANKGSSLQGVTLSDRDFPVTIRNNHSSDEIKMRYGTKKLNRYFIDNKTPLKDRLTWPVLINKRKSAILVPGIGCDINHYSDKHNMFMIKL